MMPDPDEHENLKMSGVDALFGITPAILLLMTGLRATLDERTLPEPVIGRLYTVYAALATCASELTEIATEIDGDGTSARQST